MKRLLMSVICLGTLSAIAGEVKFKGEEILVDGKPFLIRGGEMHPQRIPREYWQHRIRMAKAMGCNTISSYFFWNGFERADGSFDFKTENRDVAAFLELCKGEGMKVLFRPGPYCCGEWDCGGLPIRFLEKPGYVIRSSKNEDYKRECEKYLNAIAEVVEPFLWKNGGPIILTQVENEYGSWPDKEPGNITWLKNFWKAKGFAPFYMADGAGANFFRNLPYPDKEIAVGLDPGTNEGNFNAARAANPGVPVLSAETYPGWLRHWGEGNWRPSDITGVVNWFVNTKKSFCFYVVHGGTSFGFTTGANDGGKGGYQPDMTSYDYGAPISEQGLPTKDYYRYREILAREVGGVDKLPKVPEPIPTMDIPAFTPSFFAPLTSGLGKIISTPEPLNFEAFGQNQGIAVYATKVPAGEETELKFERVSDYAHIYLNDRHLVTFDRRFGACGLMLPKREKEARLMIVVEGMGHINFGRGMKDDYKGIRGKVTLGGKELKNWKIAPKSLSSKSILKAKKEPKRLGEKGGHFTGKFNLTKTADTFLDMSKWTKGTLYVNGHNLGRYWRVGPQYSLYCPVSFLKVGENRVDVIEMELSEPQPIRGLKENLVIENGIQTSNADNVW